MAGKACNRVRNKTISFYVTQEENIELQARIKVSGMAKGEYFIQSLLYQEIKITVGKYRSDRLSLEFKKLREALEAVKYDKSVKDVLRECKALLSQLYRITEDNNRLSAEDFKTK